MSKDITIEKELPDNIKFVNSWLKIFSENRNKYKNYKQEDISLTQKEIDEYLRDINKRSSILINDLFTEIHGKR